METSVCSAHCSDPVKVPVCWSWFQQQKQEEPGHTSRPEVRLRWLIQDQLLLCDRAALISRSVRSSAAEELRRQMMEEGSLSLSHTHTHLRMRSRLESSSALLERFLL